MRIGNWTFIGFKDIGYNGILPKFRYRNTVTVFRFGVSLYFFKYVLRIDYSKRKIIYKRFTVIIKPNPDEPKS